MIETAKMKSEKVSPLDTVLKFLPTKDRIRREAIDKGQYEGIFLVWHGVKMEAVAEQVAIGEHRMWELGLGQERFNVVTEGIRLGALKAIEKVGGVVALTDFAEECVRNAATRSDGPRPEAATTVGSKAKAVATDATENASGKKAKHIGLDSSTCLVEEVLAHKPPAAGSHEKVKEYLIKWKGDDKYTWEPKDNASIGGLEATALNQYWARLERVRKGKAAAR